MPPHVPRRQYPESQPAGQREFPVSDGARWARWFWGLALGAAGGFVTSFSHDELRSGIQLAVRVVACSLAGGFLFARFGDRGLINVWSWWLVAAFAAVVVAFF